MGDPYAGDHVDDADREELSDEEQQKANDEIQELGKQGLTREDLP